MSIFRLAYVLHSIRISGIINAVRNGFLRDRVDKNIRHNNLTKQKISPGSIVSTKPIANGIQVKFEQAELEITFLTKNTACITWSPGKPPVNYTILEHDREFSLIETHQDQENYKVSCGNLHIDISKIGELIFYNDKDEVLKHDLPPVREGEGWTLSSPLLEDEHIYGLGERAGKLDLRNGIYRSWNTDAGGSYTRGSDPLYLCTPIYLSISEHGSHLVYHENSYPSTFAIGDQLDASFTSGKLRYYVITGSLTELYTELSDLVGYPNLPPLWALGYQQCRWGYHTETEVRNVVKGFEEHDIPLSAIHLDIDYMDRFKVFSIDSSRFPSMKRLTADLAEKGIKTVVSINPAVKIDRDYQVYQSGVSHDVFCKLPTGKIMKGVSWPGWCVFPDFTKASARDWWREQYKYLLDEGIAGIWHDMNEPSSFAAWGDKTVPISTVHDMEGNGGDHIEAHNIYGLLMNKAAFEALMKFAPSKRPWIFSRSGWAGLQRYAWNWTGDIESSWDALQVTIPMILGLGLSGHAFSGVDIGGFSGDPDAELYLRWFQLATFLPLCRTHSAVGTKAREPWVFGEPTTSIVREFAWLRHKILPYFYTVAWETSRTGIPPIRPIYWTDPDDKTLWDVEDEFLLGDNLLIAPVVRPSELARNVTFPAGVWYSFWSDERILGPCKINIPTPLEQIPIFIKGGTILPMDEHGTFTLHIFPGIDSQSINQIYFDDGDGYGASRTDTFQLNSYTNGLRVSWISHGDYPFPYKELIFQVHGIKLEQLSIDGEPHICEESSFTSKPFTAADLKFA